MSEAELTDDMIALAVVDWDPELAVLIGATYEVFSHR